MEEDISLDLLKCEKVDRASWRGHTYGEAFFVDTNLRRLCKYDSQGISEQVRLDVNINH
jgi:hypothetical protein